MKSEPVKEEYKSYAARLREEERAGKAEVYLYEHISNVIKMQVVHIWHQATGGKTGFAGVQSGISRNVWSFVYSYIAEEFGYPLLDDYLENTFVKCCDLLQSEDYKQVLSVIELSFIRIIMAHVGQSPSDLKVDGVTITSDAAVTKLNSRFKEHSLGYEFVDGRIMSINSEYIHSEVVIPALTLLHGPGFSGPEEEFRKAHLHFREGRNEEAITDALKAFESTMKTICAIRGWTLTGKEPAKDLIKVIMDNHLIPDYLQTEISGIRNVLEAGLPTVRNKNGGHGQGPKTRNVPDHMAAFALHQAAANIVLLIEAHKAMP